MTELFLVVVHNYPSLVGKIKAPGWDNVCVIAEISKLLKNKRVIYVVQIMNKLS